MIYNHMPEWIYSIKDLSSSSKLIMQRIFTLSKDGNQHVFFKREKFSAELGISLRQISRAFQELVSFGLVEVVKNKNHFDRTKVFRVTEKALNNGKESDEQSSLFSDCQHDNFDLDIMATSSCHNDNFDLAETGKNPSLNGNFDLDIMATSSCHNDNFDLAETGKNPSLNGNFDLAIMATSSSDRSFSKNRESEEGKITHSPSSFSDVFSVQTAEEILSKTSDELNVSLSESKLHSEAVKFFDYYSEKNLSIGQLKVKARTWIDNCKKYPDFKNKKTYDTAAKEGLIGVLREECEKEMIEQEKDLKPKEQNSNPLLVTDFYDAMKKEGYSNSIFEYPIK